MTRRGTVREPIPPQTGLKLNFMNRFASRLTVSRVFILPILNFRSLTLALEKVQLMREVLEPLQGMVLGVAGKDYLHGEPLFG